MGAYKRNTHPFVYSLFINDRLIGWSHKKETCLAWLRANGYEVTGNTKRYISKPKGCRGLFIDVSREPLNDLYQETAYPNEYYIRGIRDRQKVMFEAACGSPRHNLENAIKEFYNEVNRLDKMGIYCRIGWLPVQGKKIPIVISYFYLHEEETNELVIADI